MWREHPILECAFACTPPVAQLSVQVVSGVEPMTVQNPSGVTIGDVVDALAAWLAEEPDPAFLRAVLRNFDRFRLCADDWAVEDRRTLPTRESMLQKSYDMRVALWGAEVEQQGFVLAGTPDGEVVLQLEIRWGGNRGF